MFRFRFLKRMIRPFRQYYDWHERKDAAQITQEIREAIMPHKKKCDHTGCNEPATKEYKEKKYCRLHYIKERNRR